MKKILLLLVALLATTTVWAEEYITDVMVIGGTLNEVNMLKSTYSNLGWTVIDQDLNAGCGSSSDYIYMLYKKADESTVSPGAFITKFVNVQICNVPQIFTVIDCNFNIFISWIAYKQRLTCLRIIAIIVRNIPIFSDSAFIQ